MVQSTRHSSSWPGGPGEMAQCIRRHDWAATALGPIAGWPPHLRTAVDICLASPLPTALLWGEQRLQLYNDAYLAIVQDRHPAALGQPARGQPGLGQPGLGHWAGACDRIGPMLDRVFVHGEPALTEDWQVMLDDAAGRPVERFFTFAFSAVRDRYGSVAGAIHTAIETTPRAHAERRLRELGDSAGLGADFLALFQAAPGPLLLLAPPDFRILAADDTMLRLHAGSDGGLLGRTVFELFAGHGIQHALRASLDRVLARQAPDTLPMVMDDGPAEGPGQRWWAIDNTPLLGPHGEVALVIHRADDVSELARLRHASQVQMQREREQQDAAPLHETGVAGPGRVAGDDPTTQRSCVPWALLDAISEHVCAFDRGHRLAYANRAMRELIGLSAGDPLGHSLEQLGYPAGLAQRLERQLGHVFGTGLAVEDEVWLPDPRGGRSYFHFVWRPVRVDDGHVEQVVGVSRDTSERHRMEERLRQGEARQSFLLQLGDRVRGLTDARLIMATVSEMVGRHLDVGRCGYGEVSQCGQYFNVERDWTDGAMPGHAGTTRLADFGDEIVSQYRAGQTVVLDDTMEDARTRGTEQAYASAGSIRAGVGVPLLKGGRFVAAFYVHQTRPRHWREEEVALLGEVAERTWAAVARARAERALRASERRYRALFDAIDEGFCLVEKVDTAPGVPSDFRYLITNPAFVVHTGIGEIIGKSMREVFPDAAQFWYDTFDSIIESGDAYRFEHGLLSHERVFDVYACRLDDGTRHRIAVIFNDITERKRHEQHQRVLLNELNHRVKNTLATVQSLAMQSFRAGADPQRARQQFEGRLMALSRTHDILTRESWGGAPLAGIVQEAFAPYRDDNRDRLQANGAVVWLSPRQALAFAMVLHELCTNAVKYGALSSPDGQVTIDWAVHEGALRLRWAESGGPVVVPPARRGFGSRLIERGLRHEIGGRVALAFAPAGVTCTIEAPLAEPASPVRSG